MKHLKIAPETAEKAELRLLNISLSSLFPLTFGAKPYFSQPKELMRQSHNVIMSKTLTKATGFSTMN